MCIIEKIDFYHVAIFSISQVLPSESLKNFYNPPPQCFYPQEFPHRGEGDQKNLSKGFSAFSHLGENAGFLH